MPFELRLLNGMNPPVPEVTVLIHKVTKDRRTGEYQLHIAKVLGYKHWDKRKHRPEAVKIPCSSLTVFLRSASS
jgi:hypothetical protein